MDSLVFDVDYPENALQPCREWCVSIPKCPPVVPHTITVKAYPGYSDDCNQNVGATFKINNPDGSVEFVGSKGIKGLAFPNPLEAATNFKTTIPFSSVSEGSASLLVRDATGKTVYEDSEDLLGAGQHFFYLSARSLPAGQYFYTVSVNGLATVNEKILVIK